MFSNFIAWTFIGIFAGFLVQYFFPLSDPRNLRGTIIAGIIGAFFGGVFYSVYQIGSVALALDPGAAFIALLGSLSLIYLINAILRSESLVGKKIKKE